MAPPLRRRLLAEGLGTLLLVTAIVGSGAMAQRLSRDTGLVLLENTLATVFALGVLIVVLGPVSGAHLNPAVSLADWLAGRRSGTGLSGPEALGYAAAQVAGGVLGALLANAMFGLPAGFSATDRGGSRLLLAEVVATAGLVLVVLALARAGRTSVAAPAVAAYIGAAYWFTASTSFANPAVTVGRAFSDSFAGVAPSSVPGFVTAQLAGALLGLGLARLLYPDLPRGAARVVVPSDTSKERA